MSGSGILLLSHPYRRTIYEESQQVSRNWNTHESCIPDGMNTRTQPALLSSAVHYGQAIAEAAKFQLRTAAPNWAETPNCRSSSQCRYVLHMSEEEKPPSIATAARYSKQAGILYARAIIYGHLRMQVVTLMRYSGWHVPSMSVDIPTFRNCQRLKQTNAPDCHGSAGEVLSVGKRQGHQGLAAISILYDRVPENGRADECDGFRCTET